MQGVCRKISDEPLNTIFIYVHEHSIQFRSQYKRITELTKHVWQPENQSKLLRTD